MKTMTVAEARKEAAQGKRPHKYGAKRTRVGDITFASKLEAKRWCELLLLEKAGAIRGLTRQPQYDLYAFNFDRHEATPVCRYVADFAYTDTNGTYVTEDVKGFITETAKLKLKWFAAQYGRSVIIIKK